MSAADRMVVRTLDGSYRSVPRRQGLGMIAAGRAQHAPATFEVGDEITTTSSVEERYYPEPPAGTPLTTEELARVEAHDAGPEPTEMPAVELPPEPRGNASRAEWATYAESMGVEVTDGMSRNRIRDAAQDVAQTLDRLPQPALLGGRLDTPEDEPVTEESVTDDEDPGTR